MPGTAKLYNLNSNHFDPKLNLSAGIRHLHMLLNRYGGDKKLSLAAYNAGEGAVSKYNGIPPYAETQDYVVKVMGLYNKYLAAYSG
ncbi:MAG: lytic transglycosylase domain-containing protein [Arenicella sp.]